jgi:ADP-ribose pyrophosphatase YjhB (NUDIX family)
VIIINNLNNYFKFLLEKKAFPGVLVVLYKKSKNRLFFLLLKHSKNNIITFPSGFLSPTETYQDAAVKEILEETGFQLTKFTDTNITHTFTHKNIILNPKVSQKVYLAKLNDNQKETFRPENGVDWVKWFDKNGVIKTLSYPELRETFIKAYSQIEGINSSSPKPSC